MSDSVTVALSNSAWTDISGGDANGLVTNSTVYKQLVKEAGSQPSAGDLTGHTMKPGPDGFFNWAAVSQIIWARALPSQVNGIMDCEVTSQA